MSDDNFDKLFKYIQDNIEALNNKVDSKASQDSVDSVLRAIDQLAKDMRDMDTESAARDSQINRLTDWANKTSAQTGISFESTN